MDLVGYSELYAGLLAVYVGYAVWARLDVRPPFGAALLLILAGAAAGSYGATGAGEVLGVFGFLTLLAAVAGAVLARGRVPAEPRDLAGPPPEPVDHG